jgi:hypothetical protein
LSQNIWKKTSGGMKMNGFNFGGVDSGDGGDKRAVQSM